MKRGLIVGKFYPFHSGHAYLISVAEQQSDHVTVLVCDRSDQAFTGEERASWIREMFPHVEVLIIRDIMNDDDSELWAAYTKEILGYAPEVVFTSEDYGDTYARFLGAKHVLVDRERQAVPISGTSVRKNPYTAWEFLSKPVKAALTRRVAIVGAESTGTTTLAKALAKHYGTVWVPEFGRTYTEGKITSNVDWQGDEFVFIAQTQNKMEDAYARLANKILFCDTNSWATRLWHERYRGDMNSAVDAVALGRRYDLVIVTDDDIPFEQDGLRDGEHIRHTMHTRFIQMLDTEHIPYMVASGNLKERTRRIVTVCDRLLTSSEDVFKRFPRQNLNISHEN